jgi:hypothetical protein
MDFLLAGIGPSLIGRSRTGNDVQRRYLWKLFRLKPNTIPGSTQNCSASCRNAVRLQPGILFGIARNAVRLHPGIVFALPRIPHEIPDLPATFTDEDGSSNQCTPSSKQRSTSR